MKTKILKAGGREYEYYSISDYAKEVGVNISALPYSMKVLLENVIRGAGESGGSEEEARMVAAWKPGPLPEFEISYRPGRVVMQDFTGVPAIVDLAAMRDAVVEAGGDGSRINPLVPVDLVIDHSVTVDHFGSDDAYRLNVELEFERNRERYRFLKWGQEAFDNFRVVPPGTGIIHQVNLEYLAEVVWTSEREGRLLAYPDTLVGTDSHTTMINGLGVLGWGVGGIEAEAAMLGQPVTMLLPEVIGVRLDGRLPAGTTATDLVLTVTRKLRSHGVVGKFVEFFGPALDHLSLADRATISNMAPEYGATCGIFPLDDEVLRYMEFTGRDAGTVALVEAYAREQGMWRDDSWAPAFTEVVEIDVAAIRPSLAGPRRPQDKVLLEDATGSFEKALTELYSVESLDARVPVEGKDHDLSHGEVVIAAITSCTNTSNPSVMVAAGLIAKKAVERGLSTKPWVKTSLAPGSQVVMSYLAKAGLDKPLEQLGFNLVGYGCTTCIGNSGPLPDEIRGAIAAGDLVTCNVLSGNRNFEGRINPDSRASYLASPPLVVAYALAGTMRKNLLTEPIGEDADGNPVMLSDLWPSTEEIDEVIGSSLSPAMFKEKYADVFDGTKEWKALDVPEGDRYDWDEASTYIRRPPFFKGLERSPAQAVDLKGARCLAILPDSTTTDHISPAGNIAPDSPAGAYLTGQGVALRLFNSYGSRRGNHEVMIRGTFGNIRLKNAMAQGREGGFTRARDGGITTIYNASIEAAADTPLVVLAGREYGTGSSRDWAAKGTLLLGVRAVVARSYERIHRSNLVGMGVLPLQFEDGLDPVSLGITGDETFGIEGLDDLAPGGDVSMTISFCDGRETVTTLKVRIDTAKEMMYFRNGGILPYVLRRLM